MSPGPRAASPPCRGRDPAPLRPRLGDRRPARAKGRGAGRAPGAGLPADKGIPSPSRPAPPALPGPALSLPAGRARGRAAPAVARGPRCGPARGPGREGGARGRPTPPPERPARSGRGRSLGEEGAFAPRSRGAAIRGGAGRLRARVRLGGCGARLGGEQLGWRGRDRQGRGGPGRTCEYPPPLSVLGSGGFRGDAERTWHLESGSRGLSTTAGQALDPKDALRGGERRSVRFSSESQPEKSKDSEDDPEICFESPDLHLSPRPDLGGAAPLEFRRSVKTSFPHQFPPCVNSHHRPGAWRKLWLGLKAVTLASKLLSSWQNPAQKAPPHPRTVSLP